MSKLVLQPDGALELTEDVDVSSTSYAASAVYGPAPADPFLGRGVDRAVVASMKRANTVAELITKAVSTSKTPEPTSPRWPERLRADDSIDCPCRHRYTMSRLSVATDKGCESTAHL